MCYHEKDSSLVIGIVIPTLETKHRYKCTPLELSHLHQNCKSSTPKSSTRYFESESDFAGSGFAKSGFAKWPRESDSSRRRWRISRTPRCSASHEYQPTWARNVITAGAGEKYSDANFLLIGRTKLGRVEEPASGNRDFTHANCYQAPGPLMQSNPRRAFVSPRFIFFFRSFLRCPGHLRAREIWKRSTYAWFLFWNEILVSVITVYCRAKLLCLLSVAFHRRKPQQDILEDRGITSLNLLNWIRKFAAISGHGSVPCLSLAQKLQCQINCGAGRETVSLELHFSISSFLIWNVAGVIRATAKPF